MKSLKLYNKVMGMAALTENDNPELLSYIESHKEQLHGPENIKGDFIIRTVGPEEIMLNHEHVTEFNSKVDAVLQWLKNNHKRDVFLLCEKYNDKYYILDGNHTFEALKKLGNEQFPVIFTNDSILYNLINAQ